MQKERYFILVENKGGIVVRAEKREFQRFVSQSDIVFVIPVYQRNYDWKKGNCKQLFDDIIENSKDIRTHFIGTICHKMDGRYKSVIIDGQQRITSLMLLLKAIYDMTDDERLQERIREQFLINKYSPNQETKIKLKPIKKDEAVYSKLIELDSFDEEVFTEIEKESNIYQNYSYFKGLLESVIDTVDLRDVERTIEVLEIVELELENENPQVIFESLNSTGLDLTNADLLRNYLLMSLDYKDQEEMYRKYWLVMEELIGSDKMEQFFLYYLIYKRRSDSINIENKHSKINSNTLYYAFKKYYPNINKNSKESVESCLNDMRNYCKFYSACFFKDDTRFSSLDKISSRLYQLFKLLEVDSAAIFFFYLAEKYRNKQIEDEDLYSILDALITFSVRSRICGRGGINNQVAALSLQKIDTIAPKTSKDYVKAFWNVLLSGRGAYSCPKDEEFYDALANKELSSGSKTTKARFLLTFIEKDRTGKYFEDVSIDFICPKNLSPEWKNYLNSKLDLGNFEANVQKIGNLVLIDNDFDNGSALFQNKKLEYAEMPYSYTRELSTLQQWTSKEIQKRSEYLAKKALAIWSIPKEYNKGITIDTGINYSLNDDYSYFTSTKPNYFSIDGKGYSVTHWSDIMNTVCNYYYSKNRYLFNEFVKEYERYGAKNFVLKNVPNDMSKYVVLGNGDVYVNTTKNVKQQLEFINVLVDFYDRKQNTNIKSEIWFTLRR